MTGKKLVMYRSDIKGLTFSHSLIFFKRFCISVSSGDDSHNYFTKKTSRTSTTAYVAFCLQLAAELKAVWDILQVLNEELK